MPKMQYRLKAFLFCVAGACILAGASAKWLALRNAAVNDITASGGSVYTGDVRFFSMLRPKIVIFSRGSKFDTIMAQKLADIEGVEYLKFHWDVTNPQDLKPLSAIKSLREISISEADDSVFAELAAIPQLSMIEVSGDAVDGTGLEAISELKGIQKLNLSYTNIGDVATKAIGGMRSLKELRLRGTRVSDAGVANLLQLTQLHVLDLSETQVSDRSIEQIASLSSLEKLSLSCVSVTADGLTPLIRLKNLRALEVSTLWVNEYGAPELSRELPACDFTSHGKLRRATSGIEMENDDLEGAQFDKLLKAAEIAGEEQSKGSGKAPG